jgi:hypothetical protein
MSTSSAPTAPGAASVAACYPRPPAEETGVKTLTKVPVLGWLAAAGVDDTGAATLTRVPVPGWLVTPCDDTGAATFTRVPVPVAPPVPVLDWPVPAGVDDTGAATLTRVPVPVLDWPAPTGEATGVEMPMTGVADGVVPTVPVVPVETPVAPAVPVVELEVDDDVPRDAVEGAP